MGNQQSAPEGYTDQEESLARLQTNANQARLVGVPEPVGQTQAAKDALAAASPRGLNLSQVTNTDPSAIDAKEEYCSKFSQLEGLRKLQKEVGDRTALEPGCGWMYGNGTVSQGAFGGVKKTPSGSTQEVPFRAVLNGATFNMDLEDQEMKITNDLKQEYTTCESLKRAANMPDLVNVLGFCKETGKVIPIERSPGVAARPRYPDHPDFRCRGEIVVPELATKENCAAPTTARQGFRNPTSADKAGSAYVTSGGSSANFHSVFNTPQWAIQNERGGTVRSAWNGVRGTVENFADTVSCEAKGNLRAGDKDCLQEAARQSGFKASGSYLPYLTSGTEPDALMNYNKLTNTDISIGGLLDGTKTMNEVISILRNVRLNMSSSNARLKAASIDLFITAGTWQNEYNLCEWFNEPIDPKFNETFLSPTMIDAERYAKCMENYWRIKGGDSRGIAFPTLENYNGKRIQEFKDNVTYNTNMVAQKNPVEQSSALARHIGVATYQETTSGTVVAPPQACLYTLEDIPGQVCPAYFPIGTERPKIQKKVVVTREALAGGECKHNGQPISNGQILTVSCDSSQPLQPQNCVWQRDVSNCSKTCGPGKRTISYIKTVPENALGTCAPKPADSSEDCIGDNCSANDCKFTTVETQKCPDGSDESKCGQQFKRITKYVLDSQNPSQAAQFCPVPNPKIEDCPVIKCPPSDTSALADCEAAFYMGENYTGNAVRLPIGEYDMDVMVRNKGIPNDSIQSIRLGKGVDVMAYYHAGFTPPVQTYTSDTPTLGWFKKNISGLKIIYKSGGVCAPPPPLPPAPGFCGCYGKPSSDNRIRVYNEAECKALDGNFYQNGECLRKTGGSLSWDCRELNARNVTCPPAPPPIPDCEVWLFYETNYRTRPGFPSYTALGIGNYNYDPSFIKRHEISWIVRPGQVNNRPIDDEVKSIKVGRGVKLIAYSDPNFAPLPETIFIGDVPDVGRMYGSGPGISSLRVIPNVDVDRCPIPRVVGSIGKCSPRTFVGRFKLTDVNKKRYDASAGRIYLARSDLYEWRLSTLTAGGNGEITWIGLSDKDVKGNTWRDKVINDANINGIPTASEMIPSPQGWGQGFQWYFNWGNKSKWNVYNGKAFCWFVELADKTKPSSKLFLQRVGKPDTTKGQELATVMVNTDTDRIRQWRGMNGGNSSPLVELYGGSEGLPRWEEEYDVYYSIWNP